MYHVHTGTLKSQREHLIPWYEVWVVVSPLTWVLETNLGPLQKQQVFLSTKISPAKLSKNKART